MIENIDRFLSLPSKKKEKLAIGFDEHSGGNSKKNEGELPGASFEKGLKEEDYWLAPNEHTSLPENSNSNKYDPSQGDKNDPVGSGSGGGLKHLNIDRLGEIKRRPWVARVDEIEHIIIPDGQIVKFDYGQNRLTRLNSDSEISRIPQSSTFFVNGIQNHQVYKVYTLDERNKFKRSSYLVTTDLYDSLTYMGKELRRDIYGIYNKSQFIISDALRGKEGIEEGYYPELLYKSERPSHVSREEKIADLAPVSIVKRLVQENKIGTLVAHSNGNAVSLAGLIDSVTGAGSRSIRYYGVAPAINISYLAFSKHILDTNNSILYYNVGDPTIFMSIYETLFNAVWSALLYFKNEFGEGRVVSNNREGHGLVHDYKWAIKDISSRENDNTEDTAMHD